MSTAAPDTRPLGMTEAYHATQKWLSFIGEPTTRIEDPTDGVLQLFTANYLVRVRVDSEPAGQGAVIAMMRAAAEVDDLGMLMLSPTGYNPSALEFAELRKIPLFTIDHIGDVIGENADARAIIPDAEYVPPFSERALAEPDADLPDTAPDDSQPEDPFDNSETEWKTCPVCDATQHPQLVQCAACGADLDARRQLLAGRTGTRPEPYRRPSPLATAPDPSPPLRGASTLQCRECGSHDIELIHHQS